ncbi:nuclear transport factor 2 family protein [SAR202 cluster bacterium AD-802-E10_MRT_200m]|nr:nuclear transport factor 2 family protein [SAR202 cluster bacterium AD-802-E10_MRT_200m]
MPITASEALNTWKDGFKNGNSDAVSEMITDDFIFIGGTSGTRTREETLDWVSNTPDLIMDDLEVLYENDEVMVCLHSVVRNGVNGQVMAFARKKGDKISFWRVVRMIKPD